MNTNKPMSADPLIEVVPPVEKEPEKFAEKLMGFAPKKRVTSRKPKAKGKQIDVNLISKLAPTIVATFAATYARSLLKDPYKVCAPSQKEVLSMVGPLFDILSRSIEITGQASQTVIDLINVVIASILFGTRSYVTYAMIKENETNGAKPSATTHAVRPNVTGKEPSSIEWDISGTTSSIDGTIGGPSTISSNGSTDSNDVSHGGDREGAELFAHLFKKDIDGRIRLGLLPNRIPE
jgi:hypothetical protein